MANRPVSVRGAGSRERLRLQAFVPYRLSVLTNTISTAISAAYAERFKLTIPEWRAMAVLGLEPGLSAADVAERTAMDKVAVSRAIAGLMRSKRLRRAFDDADRRRSVLRLTPAGESVYWRVIPFARRYEQQMLAVLSKAEKAQFDRLLHRLQARVKELGPAVNGV